MKNKTEAIKFLEDQLNNIYFIDCYFDSYHGINMYFKLNTNNLDLSKVHPDTLCFYDKEKNWLMDYNKKRNDFWFSYSKIWVKLEKGFGLNDQEIRELIKDGLEIHFKCKVDTTCTYLGSARESWKHILNARWIPSYGIGHYRFYN